MIGALTMKKLLLAATAAIALISSAYAADPAKIWVDEFEQNVFSDEWFKINLNRDFCTSNGNPRTQFFCIRYAEVLKKGLAWMKEHPAPECMKETEEKALFHWEVVLDEVKRMMRSADDDDSPVRLYKVRQPDGVDDIIASAREKYKSCPTA